MENNAKEADSLRVTEHAVSENNYLDPVTLRSMVHQVPEDVQGSVAIVSCEQYLTGLFGPAFERWAATLGPALFYTTIADMAPVVHRHLRLMEENQSKAKVIPLLSMMVAHSINVALRAEDNTATAIVHDAYHVLYEQLTEHARVLIYPFHDIFNVFDNPERSFKACELRGLRASNWEILSRYAVTVEAVVAARKNPQAHLVRDIEIIPHIDGTSGMDISTELYKAMAPRIPYKGNSGKFIATVLSQFKGTTREILALWWRLHSPGVTEEQRVQQIKVLDAVGRILDLLYTPERLEKLSTLLPMDHVTSAIFNYVVDMHADVPKASAAQMRMSFLSSALSLTATNGSLIDHACKVYRHIGLQSEESLLKAMLEVNGETLENAMPAWNLPDVERRH